MKYKIQKIAGDASFRKFYRLTINKKKRIIIFSEKEKYKNLILYASINKFLRNNRILSPKFYSHNYKKGVAVIEDFGNVSFYDILLKKRNKLTIYKKLIDLLIKIQKIQPKFLIKTFNNKSIILKKYSTKYLHDESDLFFDWYLPIFLNKKKVLYIKREAKKNLSRSYKNLNFPNAFFVHKDFHVQNLMKVGKKIGLIDSQDAIIGNPAYDLVSLIDDVRIKTSEKLKNQIYNYYLSKTFKVYKINPKKFLEDFNILSVQRSLKIIGIFSRLYKRDQKKEYLRFIPYTWHLLEIRMNSKVFLELRKILNKNISKNIRKKVLYK